jgi:hypothetical protein
MKTAKSLGLAPSPSLLANATEVIEKRRSVSRVKGRVVDRYQRCNAGIPRSEGLMWDGGVNRVPPLKAIRSPTAGKRGNVTGFINFEPSMAGKRLQVLKEIASDIKHVAVMGPHVLHDRHRRGAARCRTARPRR